jgi:hypothetical protein
MVASLKVGYRPSEFGEAVGLCRATVYQLMDAGRIESVKNDLGRHGARIILTTPREYLESLRPKAAEEDPGRHQQAVVSRAKRGRPLRPTVVEEERAQRGDENEL